MPVLFSAGQELVATTQVYEDNAYQPLEIGRPLAIQLLTFFPGRDIREWGNRAQILITSQLRVGPRTEPAPRFVNMFLKGYNFRSADPITEWGGDVCGDPMMYYTRAFAGQEVRMTLRGVEVDGVGTKTFEQITKAVSNLSTLALFSAATPYLAAAGLAARAANTLIRALKRNDRLAIQRRDFSVDQPNRHRLQAGRYLFWTGGPTAQRMVQIYRLAGDGDENLNWLIRKADAEARYEDTPYFVVQVDGKDYPEYENFEIGRGSAALLEECGEVRQGKGAQLFQTVGEIAAQVNDATYLHKITSNLRAIKHAKSAEEKEERRKEIEAYSTLFSDKNADFLRELLN